MIFKLKQRVRSRRTEYLFVSLFLLATLSPALAQTEPQGIAQLRSLNTAFTTIAKTVTPAVVTLTTKRHVSRADMPDDSFHFFDRRRRSPERDLEGLGSGIVINKDGYILTNYHVVSGAERITVTLTDNREFEARLVGADSLTDVAVIRIDAVADLKPAKIGDSDRIEIGEWVLAIGAPLGAHLRSTVTAGIISGVGRNLHIIDDSFGVEDFIQTDAAINPGNSGGALVNLNGEVIGVNTAIATPTGRFIGYGFAIPIDLAKKVMDDIIKHGRVRRGFLGVSLEQVTAARADAFGLDRPRGVLIGQIFPDTPAESAGLKSGDILLKIDEQEVNRPNQVQSVIARKHPDNVVKLGLLRGGKSITREAKLGEKTPDTGTAAAPIRPKPTAEQHEQLGLTVQNITPELAGEYGLPENTEGVLVTRVQPGPAAEAGFREGDIIYGVQQQPIAQDIQSIQDFKTALTRLQKSRNAAFSISRQGVRTFLTVKIPE